MGAHVLLPDAPVTDFDYQAWAIAAAHPELQPKPEDFVHLDEARTVLLERAHQANLELPAFPSVAAKILNLIESPDCDMRALIKTIRLDAVVSAQVLRVANSMAFSRGVQLTTVQEAAVRLGFKAIGNIAVAAATMSLLQEHERDIHDCFRERWASLAVTFPRVAASARWLSKAFNRGNAEEAYLAGLMHDLGKVVALELCGEMVQDGDLAADVHPGVLERLIDDTHVELGTLLMKEWGMPWAIAFVCMKHHVVNPQAEKEHDLLHVVRIASALDAARTNPWASASLKDELLWSAQALELKLEPFQVVAEELKALH